MDDLVSFLATPAGTVCAVVLLGLVTGVVAHRKGFNGPGWFVLGAALFIVAFPVVLLKKRDQAALDERAIDSGDVQRCPKCAELIRPEAKVCRFCGSEVAGSASLSSEAL